MGCNKSAGNDTGALLIGFQMELEKFLFFLLSLLVTNLSATFLAFLVSAALGDFSVANAILASVGSVMILFGGLLINLKTLPTWLWWMKFLSIYYYASRVSKHIRLILCFRECFFSVFWNKNVAKMVLWVILYYFYVLFVVSRKMAEIKQLKAR